MGNIDFRVSLIDTLEDIKGEYIDYQEKIADVEDDEEYSKLWNESQRKINAIEDAMEELKKLNDIENVLR